MPASITIDQRFVTAARPRLTWIKTRRGGFSHYRHPVRIVPDGMYFSVQYRNKQDEWVLVPTSDGGLKMTLHTAFPLARLVVKVLFAEAKAG
jgi:hypothetical protein